MENKTKRISKANKYYYSHKKKKMNKNVKKRFRNN